MLMHDCHNPGRGEVKNGHGRTLGRIFLHTLVVGLGTVRILLVYTVVIVIPISQKQCSLLIWNKSCLIAVISGQRCLHLEECRPTDKKIHVENIEYLSYTTKGFFRNMTQFYCHNKAGDVVTFFGDVLILVMFFGDVL